MSPGSIASDFSHNDGLSMDEFPAKSRRSGHRDDPPEQKVDVRIMIAG
jgi:hypothetical protein